MTPEAFLATYPDAIRELATAVRGLVKMTVPDVTEKVYPGYKNIVFGVGGEGDNAMRTQFAYMAPFKAHVNLGFERGIYLSDPAGMLEGTGKELRHVKIKRLADLDNPAIHDLIVAAYEDYRHRPPAP